MAMQRVQGGVGIEDIEPGAGEPVTREHDVRIHYKLFLSRGECVQGES